jgi:quercetin dioxygenase-like cupin family protein
MTDSPLVRNSRECRTVAVVGDVYQFLATGDDTGGRYATWITVVQPGGGPPPHLHRREEEGFFVLDGEMTFYIGGKRTVLTAGMFANMPIGVTHHFKNESDRPARVLVTVAPAGLEKMFFEVGVDVPAGLVTAAPPTQAEIQRLISLAPGYGIELAPPK